MTKLTASRRQRLREGHRAITITHDPDREDGRNLTSLLFDRGKRPRLSDIANLAERRGRFRVTNASSSQADRDCNGGRCWVELLADGLTFDLVGLEPGPASSGQDRSHLFGLPGDFDCKSLEAITLRPGPHVISSQIMVPVLRSIASLAADLTRLPGLRAVAWNAADSCCEPGYFRDTVSRWIDGGAFPGLGLTSLVPADDGSLMSKGLALFTGQELRIAPDLAGNRAEAAKVALRLLHWLVENGRVEETFAITGPAGETLVLEPDEKQGIVKVWTGARQEIRN